MTDRARSLWAATRLHVWPERYVLLSFPVELLAEVVRLVAAARPFAALVLERDEVSLTVGEDVLGDPLARSARARGGPYRAVTLDLDIDLDVCGYLAPAAGRLAEAGIPIVPQCAFLKDHILIREADLPAAVRVLEALIRESKS